MAAALAFFENCINCNTLRGNSCLSSAIVQQYIPNPLTVSGYKLDLRVYVLVRSYDPLVVYIYNEGLVRFATAKYDTSTLDNVYSHLTNTSINKSSPCKLH